MFWLGAVVSLCYVPGVTGAYIATQWPMLAVLLPFALFRKGPFTVFHAIGLAFVAYAFVLWPHSPAPYASVFGLWLIVVMALAVWFGTTITDMRQLYAGLATGCAVSSVLAVLQFFGIETVATTSENPAGLYVNGVQQGTVLALVAVALATERMWFWLPPLVPGIALAHSRGALVILFIGLLGCGVRRVWVFGAVIAAGAFYLLTPLSNSDAERLEIWRVAWHSLTWFGWGPGVFYTIALPRNGAFSFYPEYTHNDGLQLLFEYGAAAALPFGIFAYALWRTDVREWPIVLAFCTAACFSMPMFMPMASFLAFVAVGRVLRVHGLAGWHRDCGGQSCLSWGRGSFSESRQVVPVAQDHTAESRTKWR